VIGALWSRLGGYVAAVGAVLAVLWSVVRRIRHDERNAVAAEAARRQQAAQAAGEAAARQAQRDGAADRLKRGEF
jgi:hypothetical protein